MKSRGFTLIELLVVIVILALLIGLGSKGLRAARTSAKKAKARIEMKSIETGIMAYFNKYGKLPIPDSDQGTTENYDDSETIISVITGNDDVLNPAKIVFIEPQGSEVGRYNDVWGAPYSIVVDSDYDGSITIENRTVSRKVGVVSMGLYEYTGNTNDVIYSWD